MHEHAPARAGRGGEPVQRCAHEPIVEKVARDGLEELVAMG